VKEEKEEILFCQRTTQAAPFFLVVNRLFADNNRN